MIGIATVATRMPNKDPVQARSDPEHPSYFYVAPGTNPNDPVFQDRIWRIWGYRPVISDIIGPHPPSLLFAVEPPAKPAESPRPAHTVTPDKKKLSSRLSRPDSPD